MAATAAGVPDVVLDYHRCITEGRKPEQRGGHAGVLTGGRLLVFGGHRYEKDSKFSYFNDVFVLDLETLIWKEVRCKGVNILPRYGHSCVLVSRN